MKNVTLVLLMLSLSTSIVLAQPKSPQPNDQAQREKASRLIQLRRDLDAAESKAREVKRQIENEYREEGLLTLHDRARFFAETPAAGYLTLLGRRARLGITLRSQADPDRDAIGAEIEGVLDEGPAADAGLAVGDVVTHLDGEPLTGRYPPARDGQSEPATKLIDLARELEDGAEVPVTYQRDGEVRQATIKARALDQPVLAPTTGWRDLDLDGAPDLGLAYVAGARPPSFGMTLWSSGRWSDLELVELGPELGEYFGTDRGLLVLRPPAEDLFGLRIGDVILSVDGREAQDPKHLLRILRSYEAGEKMGLEVLRRKSSVRLEAELPEDEQAGLFGRPDSARSLRGGGI